MRFSLSICSLPARQFGSGPGAADTGAIHSCLFPNYEKCCTTEATGNLSHFSLRARFRVCVPPSDAATVTAELTFLGAGRVVKPHATLQTGVLWMISRRFDFIRVPTAKGLHSVERNSKLRRYPFISKTLRAQLFQLHFLLVGHDCNAAWVTGPTTPSASSCRDD